MNNKLKLKLSRERMRALADAYLIGLRLKPQDDHEELLREHGREIYNRLLNMLITNQANYTLKLSSVEALAFLQWWMVMPLIAGSLEQVTVHKIIGQIDQAAKQPKKLIAH